MGFTVLIAMVSTMFIGTLLVGQVPLMFKLSQKSMQSFSTYGSGLLLGAALSIVIPEGVEAVYDASPDSEGNSTYVALALLSGFLFMYLIDEMQSHAHTHETPKSSSAQHHDKADIPPAILRKRSGVYTLPRRISTYNGAADCHHLESPRLSKDSSSAAQQNKSRISSDLRDEDVDQLDYFSEGETEPLQGQHAPSTKPSLGARRPSQAPSVHSGSGTKSLSTTIGLVAHSLADGISLGASSSASSSGGSSGVSLDIVVFLAIMVHKAPAAFGLSSILLGDGWSRMKIRQALIVFSLAAPIGAVATYFLLLAVSHARDQSPEHVQSLHFWTGFALLFSGGTFAFVSMHVMQEQNPSVTLEDNEEASKDKIRRVALTILGMVSPLALRMIAGHHH